MTPFLSRPLVDAVIVAGLVFCSFLLSAILVLWKGDSETRALAEAALEAAAWRAAQEVERILEAPENWNTATQDQKEKVARSLESIRAQNSPVASLTVFANSNRNDNPEVVAHSGREHPPEKLLKPPANLDTALHTPMADQSHSVMVPIDWGDETPRGFVNASGSFLFEKENTALTSTLLPTLGIGALVAALVGFLVFNTSGRYHKTFNGLARAEKRLRDIANAAGEYIWEVDARGKYSYLSDRVTEVLGYSPKDLLGHHPFDLLDPADHREVAATSARIITSAKPFRDFEHRMRRKDGRVIWISVNGVPVFNERGDLAGYTGAAMDITARKNGEEALIHEKEVAQAATVAKSQFLALMSHEIRTPLNSVLGFTGLLAGSPLNEAQREHVEMIRKNGEGLLVLLSDIIEFSSADTMTPAARPKPTRLARFLAEIVSLHESPAKAKCLTVTTEISAEVPDTLELDQARIRQILLNLIGNAVKFTQQGEVTIRAEAFKEVPPDAQRFPLRIAVRDSGPGVPEENRSNLFLPFSQGDSSPSRQFGGAGLGLALCQKLADLLGATIRLAETSPKGSTFALELECPIAPPPRDASQKIPLDPGPLNNLRVLVAEDNSASRRLMKILLEKLGVSAAFATNGLEATSLHLEAPYDLIFMDLQMPGKDGLDATRTIREHESANNLPRVTIVALTADAVTGDRERCLDAGMDDYISKPVRPETIERALRLFSQKKSSPKPQDAS